MNYSVVGILAALVLVITNHDVLRKDNELAKTVGVSAFRAYRRFLMGVLLYYVIDVFWGLLGENHLVQIVYVDTVLYFASMAITVLFWTRYVIAYLDTTDFFRTFLTYAGVIFLIFELSMLVVNVFVPVLFWFDENGGYHAGFARYLTLGFQIPMFLLASAYTLRIAATDTGPIKRRHMTIGLFGLAMVVAVALQMAFPLWPIYSMGCMLGTCTLHAFVVEDKKDEYRRKLEELVRIEQLQEIELGSAKRLAYTDPLTGVKSMHAYLEAEKRMNCQIVDGEVGQFAVVVFDLNDLKIVNDTKGHEAGDKLIVDACKLVCNYFKHSAVYRIGGDEFAAILEGVDYENRYDLVSSFDQIIDKNVESGGVVVASGMSGFDPINDSSYLDVFERADVKMYLRKQALKEMSGTELLLEKAVEIEQS